ncbi:MAG: type II toxin-antitoxin system RelE/ParE family toxin [Alphaproteobacteria bacterium]|nr:type II toxin-antitoxin system RelE/ParE family toxin [Alphaproteobacteria bacterium]
MALELRKTVEFDRWLLAIRDAKATARIVARLRSAELGNFGDCRPVGDGVREMRVHVGPGYRIYFIRQGQSVYLLLLGGGKKSQKRDIQRARELARAL